MPMSIPCCGCDRNRLISMRCKKNGVLVRDEKEWPESIYSVMSADMFECPNCHQKIVVGFGKPRALSKEEAELELQAIGQKEFLVRRL